MRRSAQISLRARSVSAEPRPRPDSISGAPNSASARFTSPQAWRYDCPGAARGVGQRSAVLHAGEQHEQRAGVDARAAGRADVPFGAQSDVHYEIRNILCPDPGRTLGAPNTTAIALENVSGNCRAAKRARQAGRTADAATLDEVRATLGSLPLRRDLLIEHLHALNDRFGQLRTGHLAALAQLLKLAQVEVYEVASFYHHFEVVREDAQGNYAAPPRLTLRVCSGLSRTGRCARADREAAALLGAEVRVLEAPCVGRCEQAPVAVLHQRAVPKADAAAIQSLVKADRRFDDLPAAIDLAAYLAQRRLPVAARLPRRHARCRIGHPGDGGFRPARPRRRGLPGRAQVAHRARQAAPRLMAVNIDEGRPGTFADRHYLERDPHRFLEGCWSRPGRWASTRSTSTRATNTTAAARCSSAKAGRRCVRSRRWRPCRDRTAPRRRCLHLRRGVRDDRVDRRQARHAAAAPAPHGAGRPVRPADAGAQLRDALLGARHRRARPAVVRVQRRHGRKGLRSFSVSGRVREPGVKLAPAGITLRELVDEYCGGRPKPRALRLPAGRRLGRHPAGLDGRHPARLRHPAAARLLHRLGGGDGAEQGATTSTARWTRRAT